MEITTNEIRTACPDNCLYLEYLGRGVRDIKEHIIKPDRKRAREIRSPWPDDYKVKVFVSTRILPIEKTTLKPFSRRWEGPYKCNAIDKLLIAFFDADEDIHAKRTAKCPIWKGETPCCPR